MGAEGSAIDLMAQGGAQETGAAGGIARYDVAVLGGDPAAIVAAQAAARRGARVALVLPAVADQAASAASASSDFRERLRCLQARTGLLRPPLPPLKPHVDLLLGPARFASNNTLETAERPISFRKAIIATGGSWPQTAIEGASQAGCLTPDTILAACGAPQVAHPVSDAPTEEQESPAATDATPRAEKIGQLPRRLAVIGGGPVACPWAQAFGRWGSEVHLLAREATILPDEAPDAAAVVQAALQREGVRFHLGCTALAVERMGNLRGVIFTQQGQKNKLLVDQVLLCGPRRPNVADLDLASAGVVYGEKGVVVNDWLQTSQWGIHGAGEVCGDEFASPQAGEATAQLAVHNALSLLPRRLSRLVIPHCVHTDPQIARVGPTHRAAPLRQMEWATFRSELAEAHDSLPRDRRCGFLAVDVALRSGRILTATVVGQDADELLAPLQILLARGWPLTALADVLPCYPSRWELWRRLALRYAATRPSFLDRQSARWRNWRGPWQVFLEQLRSRSARLTAAARRFRR